MVENVILSPKQSGQSKDSQQHTTQLNPNTPRRPIPWTDIEETPDRTDAWQICEAAWNAKLGPPNQNEWNTLVVAKKAGYFTPEFIQKWDKAKHVYGHFEENVLSKIKHFEEKPERERRALEQREEWVRKEEQRSNHSKILLPCHYSSVPIFGVEILPRLLGGIRQTGHMTEGYTISCAQCGAKYELILKVGRKL